MTIKLNKQVKDLEQMQERILHKIDEIKDKMDAIEEKAFDQDRDLTENEQNRYFKYEEDTDELNYEHDEIQNAIDYLMDFCEW